MSNEILNSLLKDYEQKKLQAELDSEKRKEELYEKIPRLQEIEEELNHFAISTAKNILFHPSASLEDLTQKVEKLKQEKIDILQKAKLPSDYLNPKYSCSICKDTGYITKNNDKTKICNCLKQKLLDSAFHQSNMANLDRENFSTFREDLFSNEIDLAKYHFNISPRQNMKNMKEKCLEFVRNFDNPNTKNLLFTGNTGLR